MGLMSWQDEMEGPTWMPYLNEAEDAVGLPQNLLARIAYQESHFRHEIITGLLASPAGALGIMQLMPKFFTSVNVPRPYDTDDVIEQITEAAHFLAGLYKSTHDWSLAIAAYN